MGGSGPDAGIIATEPETRAEIMARRKQEKQDQLVRDIATGKKKTPAQWNSELKIHLTEEEWNRFAALIARKHPLPCRGDGVDAATVEDVLGNFYQTAAQFEKVVMKIAGEERKTAYEWNDGYEVFEGHRRVSSWPQFAKDFKAQYGRGISRYTYITEDQFLTISNLQSTS